MPTLPFYEKPTFPLLELGSSVKVHMMEVIDFLRWTIERDRLEIAQYFDRMDDKSFFLVAATGLGKTVGVPLHVLIRQMQRTGAVRGSAPRVWVVEPRIPIAIEQAEYMNHLWDEYRLKRSRSHKKTRPLFGCITSASGRVNPDAPVQFVTTGIFELLAREDKLDIMNDRVIIDEAHVTVEQNPGVELGIALCRKAGVTVDYMSATVDVDGLQDALGVHAIIRADKIRNVIWKSNLLKPIDEAIVDLVEGTLVSPKPNSEYFPASTYRYANEVIGSALESGRSHGMLIVVNSFNGSTSDTRKLTDKIHKHHPKIPVLHIASDVVRDPRKIKAFKDQLAGIERRSENYIIIATSVVEMGITFPSLDYVVTMDSGYDQETIGDVTFPVIAPLGINSLMQRIGRVGRRRPGIAYISNEVDADYSSLDDKQLNGNALAYEPIRYPLQSASLMPLAFYAVERGWIKDEAWLDGLNLPSRIHKSADRMEYFNEQLEKLEQLGILQDGALSELGAKMSQWIGRADIAYATQLQKRLADGASREEVLFWVVATALSNTSAVSLRMQHGYFVDYDNAHGEVANRIDIWSGSTHEDLAMFRVIAEVSELAPRHIWNKATSTQFSGSSFYRWSNWAGVDARKLRKAGQAVADTFMLFVKVNASSAEFRALFGNERPRVELVDWVDVYKNLPTNQIANQLTLLAGVTGISLTFNENLNGFEWTDEVHGHVGVISQDNTPIRLDESVRYTARITPSRQARGDEASWRIASLGVVPELPPPTESRSSIETSPKKRTLLDWLFSH